MAINISCLNHKCRYYFEQICEKNVNESPMIIGENGKCESFKVGKSDWYNENKVDKISEQFKEKVLL